MPRTKHVGHTGPAMYVGMDNGTTGTIGVITTKGDTFRGTIIKAPTKKHEKQTKKKGNVTRIDWQRLSEHLLSRFARLEMNPRNSIQISIAIERPLTNPGMFTASLSGHKALEACLIVCEMCGFPTPFIIPPGAWQKTLLRGV